jgi:hypothetical protein
LDDHEMGHHMDGPRHPPHQQHHRPRLMEGGEHEFYEDRPRVSRVPHTVRRSYSLSRPMSPSEFSASDSSGMYSYDSYSSGRNLLRGGRRRSLEFSDYGSGSLEDFVGPMGLPPRRFSVRNNRGW